jgi:NAD(P)-dependent dehydrogenase (short-subunit alcohol dehydrogenase family)
VRSPALDRFVLVTGASTGIGRETAIQAAAAGFRVFAGARKADDLVALGQMGLMPLQLDVTDEGSLQRARESVAATTGTTGLHGLVNNAGIAVAGPLEHLPMSSLREQFEVNVFGALRVTQVFLPLLRSAHGRILMISSQSGKISSPLLGPYCASKFALEALTDALRLELGPSGVHVVLIEPGPVQTPIWKRTAQRAAALPAAAAAAAERDYGPLIQGVQAYAEKAAATAISAADCARPIVAALSARRPGIRIPVGRGVRSKLLLRRLLSDRTFDRILASQFAWR